MIFHQAIWISRNAGSPEIHTMSFDIPDFGTEEQSCYFNFGTELTNTITVTIDPFAPAGSIIMTNCLFYVYGNDINIGEYIYVPGDDMVAIVSKILPSYIIPDDDGKLYITSITVSDWIELYGAGEVSYEPPEIPEADNSTVYVSFETNMGGDITSDTLTLTGDLSLANISDYTLSTYTTPLIYTLKRVTVRTAPSCIKDQLIHIHSDEVIDLEYGTGGFDLYIPLKNDPGKSGGYPHSYYYGYPDDYTEDGSVANREASHYSQNFVSMEDLDEWNFQYMPTTVSIVPQADWISNALSWGVPLPLNHHYAGGYPQSTLDNYFHILVILTVDVSNVYQTVCGVEMERGVQ